MPRALQPLPPPRRPAGLPGGWQTPLPPRVGHNNGAALAPRPCFSSGATLHLPRQSAALATVCFACGWKYAGSSWRTALPRGVFRCSAPPAPFVQSCFPSPSGLPRYFRALHSQSTERGGEGQAQEPPRCHPQHRKRGQGQLPHPCLTTAPVKALDVLLIKSMPLIKPLPMG